MHCIILISVSMNNVNYFQRFIPSANDKVKINRDVWSYTRVSSKEQFERNSSVDRQIEASKRYAGQHDYLITEEFGGTYESAKSDFTRKEFKRLIDKVTASRRKPFAILVYKMSRFSRSGGNAIGLVHALVDELGVHLIEVCSGLSTTTERGKASIYESLFHAYKENLERKEIIIPFMQAHLREGKRFGLCPVGYDHYGPRVRNDKFLSLHQKIEVNKDGELLREAWQWKLSGRYSDVQILAKLRARGLDLLPQKISKIWRNPFYCGILIHGLIDEPVPGNWPAIVSMGDFIKVQTLLESNPSGFQHNTEEERRPLTRLLKCDACKGYMVGYENKKKHLHYYRCIKCRGVSMNARTTPKAKRKGANDLFIDFLDQYRLPDAIAPLVALQLTKLYHHLNDDCATRDTTLQTRLSGLEKKVKDLKIRHGLGDIDKDTHDVTLQHLNEQIQETSKEMGHLIGSISNLDKLIAQSLEKLSKLSRVWVSSDLENKRRMQKTLFPEGIYYNVKNHCYLTTSANNFISLTKCIADRCEGKENGNFQELLENSRSVARSGVEPETSGL